MDAPYIYYIRVEGCLSVHWSEWFDGLVIRNEPNNETELTGLLRDQAALFGVLAKIHDLNLVLISVSRSTSDLGLNHQTESTKSSQVQSILEENEKFTI